MKRFQSYEQFETELKQEDIPEIDLNKVKMTVSELSSISNKPFGSKRKMVLVAVVLLFTMCFGTVAMALYNGWQIKNKKGDVILNYSKGEVIELNKLVRGWDERLKLYEVENEILESLAPGEMAYFLVAKEYEISKYLPILQIEERITDLKKLKESTTTEFKIPEYLPDGYQFEYGIVTYKAQGEDEGIGEALYQEAKKTGKDYIIQRGKLSKEVSRIKLKYVNEDGYKLTIGIADDSSLKLFGYDHSPVEKFKISDKEILNVKSIWGDVDSYVFVDEDAPQNLTYSITNNPANEVVIYGNSQNCLPLPKEEAIKIIESFK